MTAEGRSQEAIRKPVPMLQLHPLHLQAGNVAALTVCEGFLTLATAADEAKALERYELAAEAARLAAEESSTSSTASLPVTVSEGSIHIAGGCQASSASDLEVPLMFAVLGCAAVVGSTGADLRKPVVAVVPSHGRGRQVWLFQVLFREDTQVVLSSFGHSGAIRTDLTDAYDITQKRLGVGASAAVWPGRFRQATSAGPHAALKVMHDCGHKGRSMVFQEARMLQLAQRHRNVIGFKGLFCVYNRKAEEEAPQGRGCEFTRICLCQEGVSKVVAQHFAGTQWTLAVDYLPGGDLLDRIHSKGALSETDASKLMRSLLSALHHIHSKGIVHRDIKAENIMLGEDERPILTDFGVAAHIGDAKAMEQRCGSPGSVAPEILRGETYGTRVDVFGAGVVLHYLLANAFPFTGKDQNQVLRRNARCQVVLGQNFEHASSGGKLFLLALMRARPEERPDAATALASAWIRRDGRAQEPREEVPPAMPGAPDISAPERPPTPASCESPRRRLAKHVKGEAELWAQRAASIVEEDADLGAAPRSRGLRPRAVSDGQAPLGPHPDEREEDALDAAEMGKTRSLLASRRFCFPRSPRAPGLDGCTSMPTSPKKPVRRKMFQRGRASSECKRLGVDVKSEGSEAPLQVHLPCRSKFTQTKETLSNFFKPLRSPCQGLMRSIRVSADKGGSMMVSVDSEQATGNCLMFSEITVDSASVEPSSRPSSEMSSSLLSTPQARTSERSASNGSSSDCGSSLLGTPKHLRGMLTPRPEGVECRGRSYSDNSTSADTSSALGFTDLALDGSTQAGQALAVKHTRSSCAHVSGASTPRAEDTCGDACANSCVSAPVHSVRYLSPPKQGIVPEAERVMVPVTPSSPPGWAASASPSKRSRSLGVMLRGFLRGGRA